MRKVVIIEANSFKESSGMAKKKIVKKAAKKSAPKKAGKKKGRK